jgi:hypothetical protein
MLYDSKKHPGVDWVLAVLIARLNIAQLKANRSPEIPRYA